MIKRIRRGHADALQEVADMSTAWNSLEGSVDAETFEAVQARFAQQRNDAAVFSKVILEYYDSLA